MAYIASNFLLSIIAAIGFGIIFNAPRKALIHCGLVGMAAWIIYITLTATGIDDVQSAFSSAFAVAIIGHILAKRYKTPIIIFIVPGIIPLVPGGTAYDAMRHFVSNDYPGAIPLATKAFIIASGIAMGLVFGEVIVQFTLKITRHYKRKSRV